MREPDDTQVAPSPQESSAPVDGVPPAAPLVPEAPAIAEALKVKLSNFEGPLDLLLHLIKRDKLDISDIPIAHITSHYLATVESMRFLNLDVAGEFLVMAATLMRIKAKMLLPPSPVEEEEDAGDPREELARRLQEYRKFKQVAERLRAEEERRARQHRKGYFDRVDSSEPLPLKPVSLFQLVDVVRQALARRGAEETIHHVELPPVTIEERMEHIRELLAGGWGQVRFEEVILDCRVALEIVATVMALLELMRLGEVVVRQYEEFGDIWMFDPARLGIGVEVER